MKTEQGFSLLELMVALAIFATLAGAVATASQLVLRQNSRVQEQLLAAWVLDNHLIERRVLGARVPGQSRRTVGIDGRQWQLFEVLTPAEPGLLRIELTLRSMDSVQIVRSSVSRVAHDQ